MRNLFRSLGLFLLVSTLFLPAFNQSGKLQAAVSAASVSHPDNDRNDKVHRYYDKQHKDWHEWNDQENRAYRHWLEERHENYRDFSKLRTRNRNDYWKWRHEHQDWR